jgi:hypothetical protein
MCLDILFFCRECHVYDPDTNETETIESRSFARRIGGGWRPGTAATVATQTLRLHDGSVYVVFPIGIIYSSQFQNGFKKSRSRRNSTPSSWVSFLFFLFFGIGRELNKK